MMKKFLEHIANDISVDQLYRLKNQAYIFPTRRACGHFKEILKSKYSESTFWSPSIFSIDDFIGHLSGKNPTDDLILIFDLFEAYSRYEPNLKFDKFYHWAQVLINDFDEIDKYLVDASKLYQNLYEIEELDQQFIDQEENKLIISQFQKAIETSKNGTLSQSFIKAWDTIGKVYFDFREQLNHSGKSYPGMLYRYVVDEFETIDIEFEHLTFCGFNALTTSEEILIKKLMDRDLCSIYWDADKSYLENDLDEAGKFARKNKKKFHQQNSKWIITDYKNSASKLEVIGTAQLVAQAKVTGNLLAKVPDEYKANTAIVLADENLLFPLLHSLPDWVRRANVTMGYPLRKSSIHSLVESYFRIFANQRGKPGKIFYKRTDIDSFLSHPHIKSQFRGGELNERAKWISERNLIELIQDENLQQLLKSQLPGENISKAIELLKVLNLAFKNNNPIEQEFNYHYIKLLKNIEDKISFSKLSIDSSLTYKIIIESARSTKVPFSGEFDSDLDIMGFLESRVLDFDNLFLLSVNENKLPASRNRITYIPYALRKVFKMPTFEDQDAIYAYHFKRLLQRAKRATIIYDTEVEIDGSGEKSRFILQLENSLKNSSVEISKKVYAHTLESKVESPLVSVDKTKYVFEALEKYHRAEEPMKLSPTKISTYLECKLRFYFKHIASIKESDEFSEDIDAREFGILVHTILEKIYIDYVGKELNEKDFDKILDGGTLTQVLEETLNEHKFSKILEGRNLLNKRIIARLVESVVRHDRSEAPLKIVALENNSMGYKIDVDGREINLGGTIDRIDQTGDGIYRIIDYKTGIMKMIAPRSQESNVDEYIAEYFNDPKLKSGFQAYYYSYLFRKNYPDRKIKAGVYGLKEINKGINFLRKGYPIDDQVIDEFENNLTRLLKEIFDPEIPFEETNDRSRCEYCTYKNICRRR